MPSSDFVTMTSSLIARGRADGQNHSSAHGQLVDEGLRDLLGRRGDDDARERGVFRPPLVAVPGAYLHVAISKASERLPCPLGQCRDELD